MGSTPIPATEFFFTGDSDMKVTFKKKDFELTCNAELIEKSENPIVCGFVFKTVEKTIIEKHLKDIEEAEQVILKDEKEYGLLTATIVDKCPEFSILRINVKPEGAK